MSPWIAFQPFVNKRISYIPHAHNIQPELPELRLDFIDVNANHIVMAWPSLIQAAQAAKQPLTSLIIPLSNDPRTHTLSGQSSVLGPKSLDPEYCAGEYLLSSITPSVYQDGTAHQLPGMSFYGYRQG